METKVETPVDRVRTALVANMFDGCDEGTITCRASVLVDEAAEIAVSALADLFREMYDNSTGGVDANGYSGCGDGCFADIASWLRRVADEAIDAE